MSFNFLQPLHYVGVDHMLELVGEKVRSRAASSSEARIRVRPTPGASTLAVKSPRSFRDHQCLPGRGSRLPLVLAQDRCAPLSWPWIPTLSDTPTCRPWLAGWLLGVEWVKGVKEACWGPEQGVWAHTHALGAGGSG